MPDRRDELKAFLRARRAALTPRSVGLAEKSRRKTPGLRREEVASIADVGVTWYTWLEQGRVIRVSRDALDRIASALRLSATDTAYFLELAAEAGGFVDGPVAAGGDALILRTVESVERAPAFALDPLGSYLAFNRLADRVYDIEAGDVSRYGRNHLWRIFADPARIALYGESWDLAATSAVGILRANSASHVGTPAFESLLMVLRAAGPEFRRRWESYRTASSSETLPLRLVHPLLGKLAVHSTRLTFPSRPGHLFIVQPPADEATRATFRRAASDRGARRR